jgi:hypothetical protein
LVSIVLPPEQQPNTIICLALHSRGMARFLKGVLRITRRLRAKEALADELPLGQGNVHPCGR